MPTELHNNYCLLLSQQLQKSGGNSDSACSFLFYFLMAAFKSTEQNAKWSCASVDSEIILGYILLLLKELLSVHISFSGNICI